MGDDNIYAKVYDISGNVLCDDFPVTLPGALYNHSVAFGDNRFLVVWDRKIGDLDVYGGMITTTPTPLLLRVNYQPTWAPTPAGYLMDDGSLYGTHGNYGWR